MITERARDLAARVTKVERLAKQLDQLQSLTTRRDELNRLLDRVRPLTSGLRALKEHGIDAGVSPAVARDAIDRVHQVAEAFATDPAVVTSQRFATMVSSVDQAALDITSVLSAAWLSYSAAKMPPVNRRVLDVLRGIRGFRQHVTEVDRLLTQLEQDATTLPRSAEDIAAFDERARAAERAWSALGGESVPEGILRFLRDASAGGAPLDSLSDEVHVWLHEHDLRSAFRVTAVRDGATERMV